jgi:hypothetical protein
LVLRSAQIWVFNQVHTDKRVVFVRFSCAASLRELIMTILMNTKRTATLSFRRRDLEYVASVRIL